MGKFMFSLENIGEAAEKFIELTGFHDIFAFYGEMGAGKTTFIREVCRRMGAAGYVTSPSFALVNEYTDEKGELAIYHFDFFRIKNVEEVFDFGYEDYFYSGRKCFIEWPEKVESLLPVETVKVYLTVISDNSRELEIVKQ